MLNSWHGSYHCICTTVKVHKCVWAKNDVIQTETIVHLHSWILHFGWHLHHRSRRSNFYFLVATQQNCLISKAKQGPNHNCRVMGSLSAFQRMMQRQWQHKEMWNLVKIMTRLNYYNKMKLSKTECLKHDLITEPNKSHPLVHVYHLVLILILKQNKHAG